MSVHLIIRYINLSIPIGRDVAQIIAEYAELRTSDKLAYILKGSLNKTIYLPIKRKNSLCCQNTTLQFVIRMIDNSHVSIGYILFDRYDNGEEKSLFRANIQCIDGPIDFTYIGLCRCVTPIICDQIITRIKKLWQHQYGDL
jgi:hypothetical protein